jgi:hypothetical protein
MFTGWLAALVISDHDRTPARCPAARCEAARGTPTSSGWRRRTGGSLGADRAVRPGGIAATETATWLLQIGVIAYGRGFVYSRMSCGP